MGMQKAMLEKDTDRSLVESLFMKPSKELNKRAEAIETTQKVEASFVCNLGRCFLWG